MQTTLTIGELAQMTGFTTHTLRVWEKRYAALSVLRLPSGHRRYPQSEVSRLRAVAQVIKQGHKPAKVSSSSLKELHQLLDVHPTQLKETYLEQDYLEHLPEEPLILEWLSATDYYDETGLANMLNKEWVERGPLLFIEECLTPFLTAIGLRWEKGELTISQEHFASDCVNDFLSNKWRELNKKNKGQPIILTTLPGEPHRCGLLMCAVASAFAGRRVISLGVNTPTKEIVDTVKRSQAVALGISISNHYPKFRSLQFLNALLEDLPPTTKLVVGGEGKPILPEKIVTFNNWENYFLWIKNPLSQSSRLSGSNQSRTDNSARTINPKKIVGRKR